jgi:hypothetical protein
MNRAKEIVKAAGDKSGLTFLSSWGDPNMSPEQQARHLLDVENARILHVPDPEIANLIRKEMGREMPW